MFSLHFSAWRHNTTSRLFQTHFLGKLELPVNFTRVLKFSRRMLKISFLIRVICIACCVAMVCWSLRLFFPDFAIFKRIDRVTKWSDWKMLKNRRYVDNWLDKDTFNYSKAEGEVNTFPYLVPTQYRTREKMWSPNWIYTVSRFVICTSVCKCVYKSQHSKYDNYRYINYLVNCHYRFPFHSLAKL